MIYNYDRNKFSFGNIDSTVILKISQGGVYNQIISNWYMVMLNTIK